jgi:alpha-L-rhamnosidase
MRNLATILLSCTVATSYAAPVHLRTNALESPLGIDTPHPTFSWRSDAMRANWMQGAYEVLVAKDPASLKSDKPDTWDSGRISSSESVDIAYAGPALMPQQRYFWAVRTWDDQGKQTVSASAWFETGLAKWQAQWIGHRDSAAETELSAIRWIWISGADTSHVFSGSVAHFRYTLHLDAAPSAASLHVDVCGKFVAHVNGEETGHHDEWSAFDREEIASLLHAGDNEIEIDAEGGTHSDAKAGSPAALAASIHITDASGTERRIVSDKSWQVRGSISGAWQSAAEVGPISMPFSIDLDRHGRVSSPDRIATDASLFRKDFSVASAVRSARLSITALGAYQAFLNGKSVSPNGLLSPGWTDFHKRVLYQTYDVTSLLDHGANTIGVQLGGGWYSSPMTWIGFRGTQGPNLLRAQLDLTMADGTHQIIVSDPSWQTAASSITFSEIYGG